MKADDYMIGGDHYHKMAVQPWDLMQSILSKEEFRGYLKGCAIKYAMRTGLKDGSDDDSKLIHYLQKLAEFDEEYGY